MGGGAEKSFAVSTPKNSEFFRAEPGGANIDTSAVGAGADQNRADFRVGPAVVQRSVRSHDIEGRREGIGQCRRGRHDRGREHTFGRPPRARIEDVSVAACAMPKRLELPPRCAQRPVVKPHDPQPPALL